MTSSTHGCDRYTQGTINFDALRIAHFSANLASQAAKAQFKPPPKRKACASTKEEDTADALQDLMAALGDLASLAEAIAEKLGIDLEEDGATGDTDVESDEEDSDEQ